ncbi:MAG TPA: amidohydrolase family protein [Armatimonadota bacterium]|jgi:N-acetylglucosamine-6-phosphate deacetylase
MLAIKNGNLVLPTGEIKSCDILADGGRITEIGSGLRAESEIDASGAYVLPGLIDLHTHGMCFESAWLGSLNKWAQNAASKGVTTFYPTYFDSPEMIAGQIARHLAETDDLKSVPQVQGFRLESPYLSSIAGGPQGSIVPIRPETTNRILEAGRGFINIWDISPELPGAAEAIRKLTEAGIVCSIAHTSCSIEEARAAVDAGAALVTHLYDTFHLPEENPLAIYPAGLVDYLLVEDRVKCEIIADGMHVDPLLVEKAFRCKGPDGVVFVTDSNVGAGLPAGRYALPGDWGEAIVKGSNDGVWTQNGGMLSGSALTALDSFRNAIRMFGRTMHQASKLWSANPARLMGLNKGEIAVGKDADFTILDENLELLYTITAGRVLYTRTA